MSEVNTYEALFSYSFRAAYGARNKGAACVTIAAVSLTDAEHKIEVALQRLVDGVDEQSTSSDTPVDMHVPRDVTAPRRCHAHGGDVRCSKPFGHQDVHHFAPEMRRLGFAHKPEPKLAPPGVPANIITPIRDDTGLVLIGLHHEVLVLKDGNRPIGSLSSGAGLGTDIIAMQWGERYALLRYRDILRAWVMTFDPEGAEKIP